MAESTNKISDAAVRRATGKGWEEWFGVLDTEGADKLDHKQIARLLDDKGYIESGWWCQSVTVAYEYARGRRVVGETKTAGFEDWHTKNASGLPRTGMAGHYIC